MANEFRSGKSAWILAIALIAVVVCLLMLGCRGSQTVWSAEVRSPDGKMIATARAFANSGFGISGAPATFVYLNWAAGSQSPTEILILDDESDTPDGTKVDMKWLTPTRLELAYRSTVQHVGFQAVKFAGVDISVRDISSAMSGGSSH